MVDVDEEEVAEIDEDLNMDVVDESYVDVGDVYVNMDVVEAEDVDELNWNPAVLALESKQTHKTHSNMEILRQKKLEYQNEMKLDYIIIALFSIIYLISKKIRLQNFWQNIIKISTLIILSSCSFFVYQQKIIYFHTRNNCS